MIAKRIGIDSKEVAIQQRIGAIAYASHEVNNLIREYFDQEPSSVGASNDAIKQVLLDQSFNPERQHNRWREATVSGWLGIR